MAKIPLSTSVDKLMFDEIAEMARNDGRSLANVTLRLLARGLEATRHEQDRGHKNGGGKQHQVARSGKRSKNISTLIRRCRILVNGSIPAKTALATT